MYVSVRVRVRVRARVRVCTCVCERVRVPTRTRVYVMHVYLPGTNHTRVRVSPRARTYQARCTTG